jgi:hypothetical protein
LHRASKAPKLEFKPTWTPDHFIEAIHIEFSKRPQVHRHLQLILKWPTDFASQAQKYALCSQIRFLPINKYMQIYHGNIHPNTCSSCQCYLGHWDFTACPKKFRSHPIKLNNCMLVHHIKYYYCHTSIWLFRRGKKQYHSFTVYSRDLLHEQLKLAGAASGLPGDHVPSKSSFFAYQYNGPPPQKTSGHEPSRAAWNRSHQNLRSEASSNRRHEKYNTQRRHHCRSYRAWLSQRLRWMGPSLPIPSGPAYKVQVSRYPKSAIIPHISLPILPVLEHFFFEHTFSVTDWMTLQLDWTTSPLLQTITTIYLECWNFYRNRNIYPIARSHPSPPTGSLLSSGN